jgi:hypothetical protein
MIEFQAAAPAAFGYVRGQRDEQAFLLAFGQTHLRTI